MQHLNKLRCDWCLKNNLYIAYHDEEWGVPVHDDRIHFEFLLLESAQAGLSWLTILQRRENYRIIYDHFDAEKVAEFNKSKVEEILQNPGIIRNRKKVESSVSNAKYFLQIVKEFGSFDNYIWNFTKGRVITNRWRSLQEVPAFSPLSDTISKDLKKRGFKFLGSTIIYAYLQSVGVINDHLVSCFRYKKIVEISTSK